jgi:glycosyltransferase involved in cell wall biosynthesis
VVSIILPNLNTPLTFLAARIDTIVKQTYRDWECIVIDGFSENGSWEAIKEQTVKDDRFRYYQRPAKGVYDAWNAGIGRAKGRYIYIATSDDICKPNLLEEMVKALDTNPDCSLAHCCLDIIDEDGKLTPHQWKDWEKVKFYGEAMQKPHKRLPPFDAIVHFGWSTVYTSIVQLLIRRDLFEKIGLFSVDYGASADFEWELRAALVTPTIHIPLYLASWRRHTGQATDDAFFSTPGFYGKLIDMAKHAIETVESRAGIKVTDKQQLYFNYLFQQFNLIAKDKKAAFWLKNFAGTPYTALRMLAYKLGAAKFDTALFLKQQLVKRKATGLRDV